MTEFTYGSVTQPVRGVGVFTITASAGTGAVTNIPAGTSIVDLHIDNKNITYVVSITNDGGAASGTIIEAGTVLKATGSVTGASTGTVGKTVVGLDSSTNRHAFVTSLKNLIDVDFASSLSTSTFASSATGSAQTATFTTQDAVIKANFENIANISSAVTVTPTASQVSDRQYEGLVDILDNEDYIAVELQARMGTADNDPSGGGFDIANDTEYTTKFIPALKDFKKKVK